MSTLSSAIKTRLFPVIIFSLVPVVFSGCGGESDSAGAMSDEVVTQGVVSKMQPLTVSDRSFVTNSGTTIQHDGDVHNSGLSTGMRVTVSSSGGVARSISYHENIKGPIDSVSADARSITVMGQSVRVTDSTWRYGSEDPLSAGDVVEVSGLADENGELSASYLHVKPGSVYAYTLRGRIKNLDTGSRSFYMGNLMVDYSGASVFGGELRDGSYVKIKDRNVAYVDGSLALSATDVIAEYTHAAHIDATYTDYSVNATATLTGTEHEVEGIVTVRHSDSLYSIGKTVVRLGDYTRYRHNHAEGVVVGARVEVEGEKNADGELVAYEVEFHSGASYHNASWSYFVDYSHTANDDSESTIVYQHSGQYEYNGEYEYDGEHGHHATYEYTYSGNHDTGWTYDWSADHDWDWDSWEHSNNETSWYWGADTSLTGVIKAVDVQDGKAVIGGKLVWFGSSTRFVLSDGRSVGADEFFANTTPEQTVLNVKWLASSEKFNGKADEIAIK